jgi:RHS repeat-associated protein
VYDAAGREIERNHVRASDGATSSYRFLFDGLRPDGTRLPGQRGRRTSVVGPSFSRWDRYNADGAVAESALSLESGWRHVRLAYTYFEDGAIKTMDRQISNGNGELLSSLRRTTERDEHGRIARVLLANLEQDEEQTLYALSYDAEGRISHATIGQGGFFVPEYDTVTRAAMGYTLDTADVLLTSREDRDPRGLVTSQHVELSSAAGSSSYDRTLSYDARRFLRGTVGGGTPTAYGYDLAGTLASASDSSGSRTFVRSGNVLAAGGVGYRLDASGRVIERDDLTLTYGPNGDVERAERGERTWTFAYDEAGQRLLKREGGVVSAAYLPGGVFLVGNDVVETVAAAGHIVGLLVNGAFRPLATDTRGTVIADEQGRALDVSPYGVRETHGSLASVVEFASSGYDADLGTVRMGLRDYDPYLGRFRTPDPLYMSDIERCAASPTACQLYAYVSNDPLSFVDPSGLEERPNGAQALNANSQVENYENSTRIMTNSVVDAYNRDRPTWQQSYYRDWFVYDSDSWTETETMPKLSAADGGKIKQLLQSALLPINDPALRETTLSSERTARLVYVPGSGSWEDAQQSRTLNDQNSSQTDQKYNYSNSTTDAANGSGGISVGKQDVASANINLGGSKTTVKQQGGERGSSAGMVHSGGVNSTLPYRMRNETLKMYVEISDNHGHATYYPVGSADLVDMRAGRAK